MLAVGGAAAAGFISQIRAFFSRIRSIFIVSVELDYTAGHSTSRYLWEHARRVGAGDRKYSMDSIFVQPLRRRVWVAFEQPSGQGVLFLVDRWRPLWIAWVPVSSTSLGGERLFRVTYFRGIIDFEKILIDAADKYNDAQSSVNRRFKIVRLTGTIKHTGNITEPTGMSSVKSQDGPAGFDSSAARPIKWARNELGENGHGREAIERLALPDDCESVLKDIQRWSQSEEWYSQKSIPWRYGIGLYGKPGTGKSSVAKGIAQKLDYPLFVLDIATMDNLDLSQKWCDMLSGAPCVALLEDIDTVFHGRIPVNPNHALTFECLLNCISGVETANGVLTIITTNDLSKIDPALGVPDEHGRSSRPGRIDAVVELSELKESGRHKIAKRILCDAHWLINKTVQDGEGETGAQFENRCRRLALDEFWKLKEGP